MFPPWMSWLVVWLIPAKYRTLRQLKTGRKIVGEFTRQHNLVKQKRAMGEEAEDKDTLLNWMLDHGTPSEVEVKEMGARQCVCVLTLGSIRTTASNISNMLYDLCALPLLGPPGSNPDISAKEWCSRMDKFDSFFVEINPQRLAYGDITLKDGTFVPAGSRLAFANFEHSMDPNVFENPREFDPMRTYGKRMSSPDQRDQHKAGMTHPNNLAFGYGNQACAGREFAVAEIKLIMARLLYEFDFKFPAARLGPGPNMLMRIALRIIV
ncbi:Ent-kaurene oxidase [Talaromyces pinophilus]|nr:Ent-kaurene oxidase [Talaromyces pinophilus]